MNEPEDTITDAENVTVLRPNRMTREQYAAKREELGKLYGDGTHAEAIARADQAFARFFWESGCTLEQVAEWEGKSISWVEQRTRFGRFLEFSAAQRNSSNLSLSGLPEFRFRGFWARTDGTNERQRFVQVIRLMEAAETAPPAKDVAAVIVEQFGDGKWHQLVSIVDDTGHPEIAVLSTLNRMMRGAYGVKAERAKYGKSWKFRIFKQVKTVSSDELVEKLRPLIRELEVEGRKGPATACPPAVAHLAHQLKRLLEEWAG